MPGNSTSATSASLKTDHGRTFGLKSQSNKTFFLNPVPSIIKRYGKRKLFWLATDWVSFMIAGGVALSLQASGNIGLFYHHASIEKILIFILSAIFTICSFRYHHLYKFKILDNRFEQIKLLSKNAFLTFLVILVLQFLIKPHDAMNDSRTQIFGFLIIAYSLIFFNRLVLPMEIRKLKYSTINSRKVLAIGAGDAGIRLAKELRDHNELGLVLVGFIDDNPDLSSQWVNGIRVLGTTDDLEKIVEERHIDEIFITINAIDHEGLLSLIQKCRDSKCQINLTSNHFGIITKRVGSTEFKDLRYVPLYHSLSNVYTAVLKRVLDVVIASIIILLLWPVFAVIAILIKMTSKGPVFYAPTSIGKDGQPFKFYKFRSMLHNVSNETHKKLVEDFVNGHVVGAKLREDSRVTSVGRFIRKYSLDEFGQLINVLKGEMSLVGPRPSTIYEYEMMEEWHKWRFSVLPGMTGLWQVAGRAEVSYIDMIMMDLYYVENCSFWQDVVILIKTIEVVLKGKGGY